MFPPDFSCPVVLWCTLALIRFRLRVFHALWIYFPEVFSYLPRYMLCVQTPCRSMVWALPISLAATIGIIIYFLFLRVLRCFSSPRSPHIAMYSLYVTYGSPYVGFPIRISTIHSLFATPRSFSQLTTSFIGS